MSEQNGTGKPRGKSRKWPITVAVVAVVAAVAGGGFWVWHEQPSFCNAICHTPMDPYLAAFEQEPGVQGVDIRWRTPIPCWPWCMQCRRRKAVLMRTA